MSLDKLVEGDILSICNALGSEIQGVYQKGQDCIGCLKDILRYLKKDSDDHSILCFLGSIRLLQNDILPLIKRYDKDSEIFDFTLRILVALTNPALLLYKENIPDDKLARNTYLQLISYLQSYKKAFIDIDVWKVLYEHLKDLLKIRQVERSNNENLFIERILILIRNVLHVPSDETVCKQTGNDDSTQDKIIKCLYESKINVLLLYICANEGEHKYCLHVLEITSLMLQEHTTETLAKANETRSATEKNEDLKALLAARQREQKLKIQKIQSLSTSRFKGVYCVKNMKSLSDNDYISHKLITSPDDVKFDLQKDYKRKPKNRARAPDVDNTRQSTLSVRLLLKKFCIEFLKTYNKVMVSVRRELSRKTGDDNDDSYYLWAISYFMQFNRFYDFQSALVSETISVQSFHHIQTQITNYQEMMLTDKSKAKVWAKRMQLGVNAYNELLETLKMMEKSQDEAVRESADTLISHVFYVIEYREMLLSLLSNYDEVKFSLSYLAKLIESTQLFLKMLENHSKKHSEIIVQKKQKKARRKKKKKSAVADEPINTEDQLNEQWNDVMVDLSEAIQQKDPVPDVTPFDGASEMTFEEQKVEAIYKIREALIASKPLEAVGLLRAARELWPEGDSFGSVDIDPDSELNVLKEIHFSGLQRGPSERKEVVEESDYDEENEEIEAQSSVSEQKLDMNDVYKRYANHKVVYPSSLLLANYRNNKPQTNLCLIKLLHRIAWNCKMHALFFQSTIFLTFQKIFHDPDVSSNPIIKEFYRFARFIVEKFFLAAQKNNKIFVEMLFWKGHKEAYELEEGYETAENKGKGWTEEEDEELKYLFDENKDICIEGQDVADIILANLNTRKRTKLQIISALKRLGMIKSAKDLKPEKRKEWQEAEIVELQHLFEDNKHSDDIMSVILDKLSIKRTRKAVVEKLLELNLIADKKEVRKKSSKKRIGKSRNVDSDENEDSFGDSEDDGDNFNHDINQNSGSSGDEDEINFFKNLDAERCAFDNEDDPHSNESEPKKKGKKSQAIWNPLEVAELKNLFHENSESDNIMHDISDSLSKKRSKDAILEKLLELGLIKSKKEIEKKGKLQTQVIWDELEVAELTNLFHENSESDDIMHDILNSLSKKRSKEAVVEKLLELGLIKSKKEIKKKGKFQTQVIWDELEVAELTNLFHENSESDDIMHDILNSLSKKRSKEAVVEKLLELGLIKSKKEIKKKGKLQTQVIWDELEVAELTNLFHENSESDDIMHDILNSLSKKRSKEAVVEKLLELGLIKSKKEIQKKEKHKMLNSNKSLENSMNEDSENDLDTPVCKKLTGKTKEKKSLKRQILSDSDEDTHNSISKDLNETLNSISESKKKQPKMWNEEEVVQLNQLFNEHKDGDDLLSSIVCNLNTKRTKKDVTHKMLEIGLIKNKTDLKKKKKVSNKAEFSKDNTNKVSKKSKSKKSSEMWEESELAELNQLYENHKGSNDIIAEILNGLTLKRNKKDIVGKMLEIGLIEDKKEIRKKRMSKKAKDKKNSLKMTESEDEDEPYQNLNGKTLSSKIVSSESSDDEDVPLISVVSNASLKKDAVADSQLHSEINVMEEVSEISDKMSVSDHQIAKLYSDSHQTSSAESSRIKEGSGRNKRKRLLIDSDSDDDDTLEVKNLHNGDSLDLSVPDSTESLQDESLFKKQKKKIRVLEDSDESS